MCKTLENNNFKQNYIYINQYATPNNSSPPTSKTSPHLQEIFKAFPNV